jgi:CspA family cold shock protein
VKGQIRTIRSDKGFGFITGDGGREYFFHSTAVEGDGFDALQEGDTVEFSIGQGPKGPRAEHVTSTPALT